METREIMFVLVFTQVEEGRNYGEKRDGWGSIYMGI